MSSDPAASQAVLSIYCARQQRRRSSWSTVGMSLASLEPWDILDACFFRKYEISIAHGYNRRCVHLAPLLIIIFLLSFLTFVSAAPSCVRFADYDSINQMFVDGGPGTKVLLCPNRLYRLSGPIIFTAADQELATYGYPTGSERAVLRVEGRDTVTAIQGDCRRCARVSVKNLIVNGNRKKLGRTKNMDLTTGLVILGGNEGQSIYNSLITNPRGFTAIHIREGDKLQCTGAIIEKNEIGPAGEEYDPKIDGDDPEMSPHGRPLADGISIACRDSFVRDNTFYDNTNAAIVVYGSPGTLIHANHIFARTLSAMAGILLVDFTPFDGDYTGTMIKSNIIDAVSRTIRVGIGLGSTVWSDDTETVLSGGSVIGNAIKGNHIGYGIAAAGLKNWSVKDNWEEAHYEGTRSVRCFDEPVNPDPMGFLYNKATIEDSVFQEGFKDHNFQYLVCIDGVQNEVNFPKLNLPSIPQENGHLNNGGSDDANPNDSSLSAESFAKEFVPEDDMPNRMFSTGSDMMDDVLEHSHQRMMDVIDQLKRKVDSFSVSAQKEGGRIQIQRAADSSLLIQLEKLQRRIEHVELLQRTQLDNAAQIRSSMQTWFREMTATADWQYDILLNSRHKLELAAHPPDQPIDPSLLREYTHRTSLAPTGDAVLLEDQSHLSVEREGLIFSGDRARQANEREILTKTTFLKLLVIGSSIMTLVWAGTKWWKEGRVHGKLL
ncbi:hypothetical protein L204_105642 [Cryptococcus depauperatus]|nr:hypothetical protein L204_02590 [Cryptococcus depauperatus CBS 7855]